MKSYLLITAMAVLSMTAAVNVNAEITQVPDRMYIEDFQLNPGDSKVVEVWFENTKPWRLLEAHIFLPEGLEYAQMEANEVDSKAYVFNAANREVAQSLNFYNPALTFGDWAETYKDVERTNNPSHELSYVIQDNNHLVVFIHSQNYKDGIMGDGTYAMFEIKVKASDDFTGGEILICPDGVKYASYDDKATNVGESTSMEIDTYGQPSRAHVFSAPVAVEDVKVTPAAGDSRYYDLQGRPVTGTPAPGIYIHQGKKVVVAE